MPITFGKFHQFVPDSGTLDDLDDRPGEQRHPVVLAMDDGRHAKGNLLPDQPSRGFDQAGYGRFGFSEARVTKWNCLFRVRDEKGIAPGDFTFRMLVAVGTLEEVRTMHRALTERK